MTNGSLVQTIVTVCSLLIAGGAAWWEIRKFHTERADARLSSIRSSLLELNGKLDHLGEVAIREAIDEVAFRCAAMMKTSFSYVETKSDFIAMIRGDTTPMFIQAMAASALQDSTFRKSLLYDIDDIRTIPAKHFSDMPIVMSIINDSLYFISISVFAVTDISQVSGSFSSKEFVDELKNIEGEAPEPVYNIIATTMADNMKNMLRDYSWPVLQAAGTMVKRLCTTLNTFDAEQMRVFQEWNKRRFYGPIQKETPIPRLVENWRVLNTHEKLGPILFSIACLEIRRIMNRHCPEDEKMRLIESYPELGVAT